MTKLCRTPIGKISGSALSRNHLCNYSQSFNVLNLTSDNEVSITFSCIQVLLSCILELKNVTKYSGYSLWGKNAACMISHVISRKKKSLSEVNIRTLFKKKKAFSSESLSYDT